MILKLSNIKIHPDQSQETICFSASLDIDGQNFATIRNSGTGGSNTYQYTENHWQSNQVLLEFSRSFAWDFDFEYIDQLIDYMLQSWARQKSPSDAIYLCTAITQDENGKTLYPFAYSDISEIKANAIKMIPVCPQKQHIFLKGGGETLRIEAYTRNMRKKAYIESFLSGDLAKFQF